jgi:hypothetical protein
MDDRVLERTQEHRRVRRALAALRKPHQRALWLAYGPHAWPSEVEVRFAQLGRCCGVVLLSETAKRVFEAEMNKKRAALGAVKRAAAAELGAKLDEWITAHCKATGDVRAQLGRVTGRMRWTKDPAQREALEREAVALAERLRTMRAGGPRILPVLDAPPEAVEEQARVERAERLGVGEWLRGRSAATHLPAIVAEAQALLEAARVAVAEELRAVEGKRCRTRRAPDIRAEFWPEAARGEVLLV